MKTVILASGNLGLNCLKDLPGQVNIQSVLTDSRSDGIIKWCEQNHIPFFKGNPRTGKAADFLKLFDIDILLSINYLFLIDHNLISYAKKYAINIHGSLLPKYRGRTPHVWSVINNELRTGITIHLIDEGCDTGDIVLQKEFEITNEMTGAEVLKKFERLYPIALREILSDAEKRNITPRPQDHSKATYFGKRIPADGIIDWQWQKERIRNWVRALSKPYPGAFSFYKDKKVIIHKIEYADTGFHCNDENGKILAINPDLVVKTPNGAIRLLDIEVEHNTQFEIGKILSCQKS